MPTAQDGLDDARKLLERFVTEMDRSEGLTHLSKALSLLDEIRTDSESVKARQVAFNLVITYLNKTKERVEQLLLHNQPLVWETVLHWNKVFDEFEENNFELPQDVDKIKQRLFGNKIKIEYPTQAERQKLIDKILLKDDKSRIK